MKHRKQLLILLTSVAGTVSAPADTYRLMAATANPATRPEVRLRWTVEDGWLPNGGFNLYRIVEGGKPQRLNEAPIVPAKDMAGQPGFRLAATPIALTGSHFRNVRLGGISAAPAFAAMRDTIRAIRHSNGPAPSPSAVSALLAKNPVLGRYYANLAPIPPHPPVVSMDEKVRRARAHMSVAGLTNPEDARRLGLAYDDPKVEPGMALTYELRPIVNGVEGAGVRTQIVVGRDPQPPTPRVEEPAQRDFHEIDLHWEPISDAEEDQFGVVTYDIYRTDAKSSTPVKINKSPVAIGFLPTKDGKVVPTVSSFQDKDVPVGPVTYRIVAHDSFGRESAPATVTATMEDWFTPPAASGVLVTQVLGKPRFFGGVVRGRGRVPDLRYGPSPDTLTVAWVPGSGPDRKPDPQALYNVYRIDTERPNDPPALLTAAPIAGSPVDMASVTLRQAISLGLVDPAKLRGWATARDRILTEAELNGSLADFMAHLGSPLAASLRTDIQARFDVRAFTDAAPPRDHYYVYAVTAEYARNKRETAATVSSVIPMPLLTAPAAPSSVQSAIRPPSALAGGIPGLRSGSVAEFRANRAYAHIRPLDVGSVVALDWGAVAGTGTAYRIYRASVTGYFPATNAPASASAGAGTGPRTKTPVVLRSRAFAYERVRRQVPEAAFALLGTSKDPNYKDPVPGSHATYYRYRVTAVNRWGVESEAAATVDVRVPATLPPSVPSVIQVAPNGAGHVTVQIRPNVAEEEVEEYHVYRKKLAPQVTVSDPGTSGPTPNLHRVRMSLGRGTGFQPVRSTVQFGGKNLVPAGPEATRVGSGAARFGVLHHDSPAVSVASAVAKNVRGMTVDPASLKEMLDMAGYQQVGVLQIDPTKAPEVAPWEDVDVVPDTDYVYRVVAVNHDKIASKPSMVLDATPYKVNADPPVNGTVSFSREKNAVMLKWAAPASGATGYVVKRAVDRGDKNLVFVQLAVLSPGGRSLPQSFVDYNTRADGRYVYRIDSIDSAGNFSEHSDPQGNPTGFLELRYAPGKE